MNLDDLYEGIKATGKVSSPEPNVANKIRDHLRNIIPEAFEVSGVWITGSNVWKFLYGQTPDPGSDIDVICEAERIGESPWRTTPRADLIEKLGAKFVTDTHPSLPGNVKGEGAKYSSKGRTIDMWASDDGVIGSLSRYPEHSHAHCRAAYSPSTGVLMVLPNSAADVGKSIFGRGCQLDSCGLCGTDTL